LNGCDDINFQYIEGEFNTAANTISRKANPKDENSSTPEVVGCIEHHEKTIVT
jgi:hypothetical protein